MIQKFHRRSIRLPNYDYTKPGAYFVTICTHNREHLFGEILDGMMVLSSAGTIVQKIWDGLPNRFPNIELDEFVVMPNHVHGIVEIVETSAVGAIHELPLQMQRRQMLLPKIIGYFKMNVAKQINIIHNTPRRSIWQRNYYEHVVRSDRDLNKIRKYIRQNPASWGTDEYHP